MIVTGRKCGEPFVLEAEHKGFADTCHNCFQPRKLAAIEIEAANKTLDKRNQVEREEAERKRNLERAEMRKSIEAAWSASTAQDHLMAYHAWLGDRSPPFSDDAESFLFFFRELNPKKKSKYYL